MPIKRKIRNLPSTNDEMSFFDPVYSNETMQMNDDENENDLLADGIPRGIFEQENKDELNETYDTDTITNNDDDNPSSETLSASKIVNRIKQIQHSIEQAEEMLVSMDKFKDLIPDTDGQYEKLRSLIVNLQQQQASYINLLNLITLTTEEHSTSDRQIQMSMHDDNNDLSLRHNVQSHVKSKIGAGPQTMSLSDIEQTNRNDNSNYDSLIGSLKSDTVNWQDQQATSDDEETDIESDKEMEKNLLLQKEQLRALQGQKRALIALKRRSEKRLIEQQELASKKSTTPKTANEENILLSDINNIRDRLKVLRSLYDQKYHHEIQQLKNSSNKPQRETESRLKDLEHVRERLDELERVVTHYQADLNDEETSSQLDNVSYLETYLQHRSQTNNSEAHQQLDKTSNELAAKRLELEQAKLALSQLQQMVKTIQPDEFSSSANSTPMQKKTSSKNNSFEFSTNPDVFTPGSLEKIQTETPIINNKASLLSHILSSQTVPQSLPATSVDSKMLAQHREIERLIESRQRLHSIKDQIASLQQTMTTPTIQKKTDLTNEAQLNNDRLNDSKNIRPKYKSYRQQGLNQSDNNLDLYPLDDESDSGEESDNDNKNRSYSFQSHKKQTNFCASENVVAKNDQNSDELSKQMREICRCLSTFIDEQKTFNRHIEQRLTTATNSTIVPIVDANFNQMQQQNLTQSLVVNLNAAYREIAVLQSEINALQSENIRLTSSLSFDNQYHQNVPYSYSRHNSKDSIYSLDRINPSIRPRPRSKFDEQSKPQQQTRLVTTNNLFENSNEASFSRQSTGRQTAIQLEKNHQKTKPINHGRNAKLSNDCGSSPKAVYLRSKQISANADLSTERDNSRKENTSKSFIIRRRPIPTDNDNNELYNYKQTTSSHFDSANEQKSKNDFSLNMFNPQPSSYFTSATQNLENIDTQTLDLQIKSIMVQLIPFMRLRIDEIFNRSTLNHIRERILFLFKQQPDSAEFIRHFQNEFSELIENTAEKYIGISIRECAADLIRDLSDVAFDELVKYKIYETKNNLQTKVHVEQNTQSSSKQEDEFANLYDPSAGYQEQQQSQFDDGENDDKYHIELAESENRPLTLIGSDEEDNDADQEETTDSELETAVSRQGTYFDENDSPLPTNLNSNGHEYVLVNRSESANIMPEDEEPKKDDDDADADEINNS
ncbi:unnamed protein product [Rotaria magnacalcarata]|uniref:Pericentriolar material 1 protein C-terminal domain-containing protein n=14 Tax=Rotaria magnacalcarata TaxID=392030 RepID=A0A819DMV7_9BILA|nr:unnamed protein product [Rotaria magnacalcarata]CAF3837248.1 unnamed protein product [Rotaria magnacalcarata]